jgi:hypothetical protein
VIVLPGFSTWLFMFEPRRKICDDISGNWRFARYIDATVWINAYSNQPNSFSRGQADGRI